MKKKPTKATTIQYFTKFLRGSYTGSLKEVRLWRGVLLQLIIDATGYSGHNGGDKYVAWSLVTENRADFKELCELADVNSDFVRDNVRKVLYG